MKIKGMFLTLVNTERLFWIAFYGCPSGGWREDPAVEETNPGAGVRSQAIF